MHDSNYGNVPAISVVIPAFNSARWIEETLVSVAVQTFGPDKLEVVVVDDGSTDGTAGITERWLSKTKLRWRVIRQRNQGPSTARNVGWRAAKARWIQFLDADDLLDPEKLEIQWKVSQNSDQDAAVIYSSWQKFGRLDTNWETDEPVIARLGKDAVTDYFCGDGLGIATASPLHNRKWLEKIGGWDERLMNGEDHDLILRVAFAGGHFLFAPSSRPLSFYRRHGISLSTISGRRNAEVWLKIARYVEEESRSRGELNPKRLARVIELYGSGARGLADYDWSAAQGWIDRLLDIAPDYRPHKPRIFGTLSFLVGIRRAIWISVRARRVSGAFRGEASPSRFVTSDGPVLPPPPSGLFCQRRRSITSLLSFFVI